MTSSAKNIDKEELPKKWYKVWWKAFIGVLGILGVVWGVLESVYGVTEWIYEENQKKQKIEQLERTLIEVINEDKTKDNRIEFLEDYVSSKKQSFAVGYRVFKVVDRETGIETENKMYRDWNGVWHPIFKDHYYSEYYKVDYYYYIDKNNGEKIYCW